MGWNNKNLPIVHVRELFDGTNYKDNTFRVEVDRFMASRMPGGPMGLLNTDDPERWQIQADTVHRVEKSERKFYVCPECESEHDEADAACCTETDDAGEEQPIALRAANQEVYVIHNNSTGEHVDNSGYSRHQTTSEDGELDDGTVYWLDESDAEDNCGRLDDCYESEHGYENRYGFPWAHTWFHIPDRSITDEQLKAAGFTVATYCGGGGNWRNDEDFRLAGIDGGGYSFSTHFVRLYVAVAEEFGWSTETTQGPVNVTEKEKTDLELLLDLSSE
jgi:hypothetical protein